METEKLRVIVAHPGKQHSFRLASALKKAGFLECYCTTVYDKPGSIAMRIAKLFARGNNRKRAENRKNPDLTDNEVVQFCELLGLITILFARLDKSKNRTFYRKVNFITSDLFGRKVAKLAIKRKVDAVICYDAGARVCFEILKKKAPDIKRIMDVSHAARPEEKRLFQKEADETGSDVLKQENLYLWNKKTVDRLQSELELTDYFLCPSTFVVNTIKKCGIDAEKCLVVPYGANVHTEIEKKKGHNGTVHFLYVGGVSYAKGVQHLLAWFSRIDRQNADLTIVGSYDPNGELYLNYARVPNIHFVGWVLPNEVVEYYKKSDVFIILSPTEGLAQVGIEAMSCGLPIICADTTGVNDLVDDGENGFVVEYGNEKSTIEAMQWFVDHPTAIKKMGQSSKIVSQKYTWDEYQSKIVKAINDIVVGR